MRESTGQISRFLAFYQVGVLRVGTAGHREAVVTSIAFVPRRTAATSIAENIASRQRFVASRGCKLNDRLERASVRDILDNILSDVGLGGVLGHVDHRRCAGDLDDGVGAADLKRKIDRRKVADLDYQAFTL